MKRYLLFDAGCAVCHQLAHAIEEAAAGKLKALSIRDSQAREWLEQAYPESWTHQPYLVVVDGGQVRAYAGLSMALRLGRLLGPRKAWRVWSLVRQYEVGLPASGEYSAERRGFLKRAALFVGSLFFFPQFGSTGGQGQKGPSDESGQIPYTYSRLAPDDPAIGNLKDIVAVGTATQHFGQPKWDAVYRIEYQETARTAYMIPYPEAADTTFLLVGGPESGLDEIGLVCQMRVDKAAGGQPVADTTWLTPDGQLIGSVTLRGGQVTDSSFNPVVIEPLGLNWDCFVACVGFVPVVCYEVCIICAGVPSPYNPACWACAACIGGGAFFCILACWE